MHMARGMNTRSAWQGAVADATRRDRGYCLGQCGGGLRAQGPGSRETSRVRFARADKAGSLGKELLPSDALVADTDTTAIVFNAHVYLCRTLCRCWPGQSEDSLETVLLRAPNLAVFCRWQNGLKAPYSPPPP